MINCTNMTCASPSHVEQLFTWYSCWCCANDEDVDDDDGKGRYDRISWIYVGFVILHFNGKRYFKTNHNSRKKYINMCHTCADAASLDALCFQLRVALELYFSFFRFCYNLFCLSRCLSLYVFGLEARLVRLLNSWMKLTNESPVI